jgi:UDP-N-acetyl-D-mannosaminuronic acid dehydrogenase
MSKLAVVGMGYVGIPVACAFADKGYDVVGIDIIKDKVDKINLGIYPISGDEPGREDVLKSVVNDGKFKATMDFSECKDANYIIVSVETPLDSQTKKPDFKALKSAITYVGKNLSKGTLVSVESTIAPLTIENIVKPALEKESGLRAGKDFYLVHCPERVMAGRLLYNLENYDRVIGGIDGKSAEKAEEFYGTICKGNLHLTDALTAEVVKTTENTYRDVQIAFANEIGLMCHELGIDAFEVRDLVNTCPFRDMHTFGPGVGGHCIPKDPQLLLSSIKKYDSKIVKNARLVNDSMPLHVVDLIENALASAKKELKDSTITVLGLSFLENSGDTRNSPSITLIDELGKRGASVKVHDPYASDDDIEVVRSLEDALKGSDCAVLMVAHDEYKNFNVAWIGGLMQSKVFVDCRSQYDQSVFSKNGFVFRGLGKPSV